MAIELDALVVRLAADTRQFRKDIADAAGVLKDLESLAKAPRGALADSLASVLAGNDLLAQSSRQIFAEMEASLRRFLATGTAGFAGLRAAALAALSDIARGVLALPAPGAGGSLPGRLLEGALSLLGFASGGPVSGGRPVIVGERGPEVFVPRTAGEVIPDRPGRGSAPMRPISITVNVSGADGAEAMRRSGAQVALAVRRALLKAERIS